MTQCRKEVGGQEERSGRVRWEDAKTPQNYPEKFPSEDTTP